MKHELTQEIVRELLRYEPETGKLFWRERNEKWFKDGKFSAKHQCRIWNTKHAGKEAFTASDNTGYADLLVYHGLRRVNIGELG